MPTPTPTQSLQRISMVGFAGHRMLLDRVAVKAAIARELATVRATVSGELVGISSAAAGADLLFLDACEEAGLKTVVLLPFSKERFSEDFDDPADWEHACRHIDSAWWQEVSPGGEAAPAAYHVVARESLEMAERMIFLWDGESSRGLGGTAETVKEARERCIPSRVIDARSLTGSWDGPEPDLQTSDPDFEDLPVMTDMEDLCRKLDARATQGAPRSRWFSAGSMSLNHMATILQVVLTAFAWAAVAAGAMLKLVLVSVAALLPLLGGRLRWRERWIRDRVRAELLRSLLHSHEPGSPLRPAALELFAANKAFLRSAALQLVSRRCGWEVARDRYLRERVDGQIGYLKLKGELAAKRMVVFGRVFWMASTGGVVLGGYSVTQAYLESKMLLPFHPSLGFVAAVLPGIAAWCLAMISVFEFKRRATTYRRLVDELIRLRPKLAAANCASAVACTMNQIERLLLNELWEWQGSRME